jgi:hypothetical protein
VCLYVCMYVCMCVFYYSTIREKTVILKYQLVPFIFEIRQDIKMTYLYTALLCKQVLVDRNCDGRVVLIKICEY